MFSVLTVCVMLGTLYPLALEAINGAKITVGAPYFNAVIVPLFLFVLLLMGLGPLAPWRRANLVRFWQRLRIPMVAGISAGVLMLLWDSNTHWTGLVAVGDEHFRRRFAVLAAEAVGGFVNGPTGAAGGNFQNSAVRVVKINRDKIAAVQRALYGKAQVGQTAFPFEETVVISHLQRQVMAAANAGPPLGRARPFKEGDGGAGPAQFIAKVKVVTAGVVKINGFFHKSQAEYPGVKIYGALGAGANQRNVM